MKFEPDGVTVYKTRSLPVRGAWVEISLSTSSGDGNASLPVRGAWVEILPSTAILYADASLPVRGAWVEIPAHASGSACAAPSLPVRGAWVEMKLGSWDYISEACRSPCGERGLKCPSRPRQRNIARRSPCGERGLKCDVVRRVYACHVSLPVRGAWVEMSRSFSTSGVNVSLPVRGAWVEIRGSVT